MVRAIVICVLRSGGCYGPAYVERLERMVRRHLPGVRRFVCLTDTPEQLDCETIRMRHAFPGKWSKVELFDPDLPLKGRILYLDLDVIVQDSLVPFVCMDTDFAIAPGGAGKAKPGRVDGYNSSVMAFDAGARPELFTDFAPSVMDRLVGDQDWIGERCPSEAAFPVEWVAKHREGQEPTAPVVLCNRPKPHELIDEPFVRRHWIGGSA